MGSANIIALINKVPDMSFTACSQPVCCPFSALGIAKIYADYLYSSACCHLSACQYRASGVITACVVLSQVGFVYLRVLVLECFQDMMHDGCHG